MDSKLKNKLLAIASAGLSISGIIFLCLSIFSEVKNTVFLNVSLACIVLANLFNIVRNLEKKKEKNK